MKTKNKAKPQPPQAIHPDPQSHAAESPFCLRSSPLSLLSHFSLQLTPVNPPLNLRLSLVYPGLPWFTPVNSKIFFSRHEIPIRVSRLPFHEERAGGHSSSEESVLRVPVRERTVTVAVYRGQGDLAKRLERVQLAAAVEHPACPKAAASCTHSRRWRAARICHRVSSARRKSWWPRTRRRFSPSAAARRSYRFSPSCGQAASSRPCFFRE